MQHLNCHLWLLYRNNRLVHSKVNPQLVASETIDCNDSLSAINWDSLKRIELALLKMVPRKSKSFPSEESTNGVEILISFTCKMYFIQVLCINKAIRNRVKACMLHHFVSIYLKRTILR